MMKGYVLLHMIMSKQSPDGINGSPVYLNVLGTDGFGRSDNRGALRDYFEVDARHIAYFTLYGLFSREKLDKKSPPESKKELNINSDKANPTDI
jgi:pyruvate dehydrogenase E1 component